MLLHAGLVERHLVVSEHQPRRQDARTVQPFDFLVVEFAPVFLPPGVVAQHGGRLGHQFRPPVLHLAPVCALILRHLALLRVGLHQLVVVLHRAVAHLPGAFRALVLLPTISFVHLRLQHLELVHLGPLRVAQLAAHFGPELVSGPERGKLFDDGVDVAYGPLQIAGVVQHQRAVEQSDHVVRLEFQHEVEILDGTVVVAHLRPEQATVEMPDVVGGIQFQCRVIILHGPPQVALVIARQGTVDVVPRLSGELPDGVVHRLLGQLVFSPAGIYGGPHVPSLPVVGVNLQRPVYAPHGRHRVFLFERNLGLQSIERRLLRIESQHALDAVHGLGIFLELHIAQRHVVEGTLVLWFNFEQFAVIRNGVGKMLQVDAAQAAQFIIVGQERIAVYRSPAILLGSRVIFQIEFGQGPEEIRLGQIGFGGNHHVEALDGKHVVLIIERVAPHEHHAVGVDLGRRRRGHEAQPQQKCFPPRFHHLLAFTL